jgi:hypothetical protein
VKKLISIGVALALLTMVVVPVGVAAQDVEDPGTYSKTPFGILGSGLQLVGDLLGDLQPIISEVAELPIDLADLTPILDKVGGWTAVDLAWMTDMSAWSMVLVGDVAKSSVGLLGALGVDEETLPMGDVAEMLYVVGARLWDPWGEYLGDATLPDVIIDNFPPGIDLPVV